MSNISITGLSNSGFGIPQGYHLNDAMENVIKEGKIIVYDENNNIYAELMYVQNRLNGICCFYIDGKLKEKITYVNNVAEGWGCDCDDTIELQNYHYIHGEKKYKIFRIEGKEEMWREEDLETNALVSICTYNNAFKKNGDCYFYEDNNIIEHAIYTNGEKTTVHKIFQEKIMKEYDDTKKLIYEGEYEDSFEKNYPRNGNGKEYDANSVIYDGEWKDNKKNGFGISTSFISYQGMWNNNLPDGEGILNDEIHQLHYEGLWKNGIYYINDDEYYDYSQQQLIRLNESDVGEYYNEDIQQTNFSKDHPVQCLMKTFIPENIENTIIQTSEELIELLNNEEKKKTIHGLVIKEGCGNDLVCDISLSNFPLLISIVIERNALIQINSLLISNNPLLKGIFTGDGKELDSNNNTFYATCEKVKRLEISSRMNILIIKQIILIFLFLQLDYTHSINVRL